MFNEAKRLGKNQYFLNRLNCNLSKRVYLPSPESEIFLLFKEVKLVEDEWLLLVEFEEGANDEVVRIIGFSAKLRQHKNCG